MGHPIHHHYHCYCEYLDLQGLVFVEQAVGLLVVVEFVGVVLQVVEFDEFVAVVAGITEHPICLWLYSGLGVTQGHS